jgi:hypothetical protein
MAASQVKLINIKKLVNRSVIVAFAKNTVNCGNGILSTTLLYDHENSAINECHALIGCDVRSYSDMIKASMYVRAW